MKELIVNADDFGLSSGANRAIIRAWQEGILTSTSLMAGGKAFDEAVDLARENPGLQVGLHLTLVQGRAVASHRGFPSLVDHVAAISPTTRCMPACAISSSIPEKTARHGDRGADRDVLRHRLPLSAPGRPPNIHMHPTVFDILCTLMPKHGISSFRLSRERLSVDLSLSRRRLVGKTADALPFPVWPGAASRCCSGWG